MSAVNEARAQVVEAARRWNALPTQETREALMEAVEEHLVAEQAQPARESPTVADLREELATVTAERAELRGALSAYAQAWGAARALCRAAARGIRRHSLLPTDAPDRPSPLADALEALPWSPETGEVPQVPRVPQEEQEQITQEALRHPLLLTSLDDPEGGMDYVATYTDLPGVSGVGHTPVAAIRDALAARNDWMADAKTTCANDVVKADPHRSDAAQAVQRLAAALNNLLDYQANALPASAGGAWGEAVREAREALRPFVGGEGEAK